MSQATTVVTFLTLTAIFCHVAYASDNNEKRWVTEATASVACFAAVAVSLLTTESSAIATFIHGAIACNVANLATWKLAGSNKRIYICSSQNPNCAFHLAEQQHLLVEDIPLRDVQFRHNDSMLCSWEAQDNREKDGRILLLKNHVSINSGETTPILTGVKRNTSHPRRHTRGRGAHTIAIITSPMSVHTLRIQKERINSPEGCIRKGERCETMKVRLPYLAAFGTIASLYKILVSFIEEETKKCECEARTADMSDGKKNP